MLFFEIGLVFCFVGRFFTGRGGRDGQLRTRHTGKRRCHFPVRRYVVKTWNGRELKPMRISGCFNMEKFVVLPEGGEKRGDEGRWISSVFALLGGFVAPGRINGYCHFHAFLQLAVSFRVGIIGRR